MSAGDTRLQVAVIGGGWAGLAAAEALAGHAVVTLFETERKLGGRASAVRQSQHEFAFVDHGQHILFGAFRQSAAVLSRSGADVNALWQRRRFALPMHDAFSFQAAARTPWPHAVGILLGRGASLREKMRLIGWWWQLRRWHRQHAGGADITVAQWLHGLGVEQKWQEGFWQPLVHVLLNSELHEAGMQAFCALMHEGVWAGRGMSDVVVPLTDLSQSWVEPVSGYLRRKKVSVRAGERAVVSAAPQGGVLVNGREYFDAAVVAVPPHEVAATLNMPLPEEWRAALDMPVHDITTVYLRYGQTVGLPAFTGQSKGKVSWFVNRGSLGRHHEIVAVIPVSDRYPDEDWAATADRELRALCPHAGEPAAVRVHTAQRLSVRLGRVPCPQLLRRAGVYLAGDYLHDVFAGLLEGAVQSGQTAAAALLADTCRPDSEWKRL